MKSLGLVVSLVFATLNCGGTSTPAPPVTPTVAVTPVGDVQGNAVQALVPATGGVLISGDGRLKISVPSGALATDQTLTIQPITNQAPGGLGAAYRLGPDGQTFLTPVTITFTYGPPELAGTDPVSFRIAYQNAQKSWDAPKSVTQDDAAQTVAIDVSHFTDYSLVNGYQLRPGTTTVMGGGTVELTLSICTSKDDGSFLDVYNFCEPGGAEFPDVEWAVNGTVGGNSSVGTIMSTGEGLATYTAPSVTPPANPVAVSASAKTNHSQKTMLVSNIWVDARPPLSGTVTSTQRDPASGLTITTSAMVSLVWDTSLGVYVTTTGQVDAKYDLVSDSCETHATASSAISGNQGSIIIVSDGTYFAEGATPVTYAGTTTCNAGHGSEAFSSSDSVPWWPATPGFYQIKPDGRFEESLPETPIGELLVTMAWSFVPMP